MPSGCHAQMRECLLKCVRSVEICRSPGTESVEMCRSPGTEEEIMFADQFALKVYARSKSTQPSSPSVFQSKSNQITIYVEKVDFPPTVQFSTLFVCSPALSRSKANQITIFTAKCPFLNHCAFSHFFINFCTTVHQKNRWRVKFDEL